MKLNMGVADRVVRVLLALVFIGLYATDTVAGLMGIILVVLAGVFILTSIFSFCPLYTIFGISTCASEKKTGK